MVLYVLLQEDAILSDRETFGVDDVQRVARERMALVQPMLEALRRNNRKEIDKYEDITDILVRDVDSGLKSAERTVIHSPTKVSASVAFDKVRNEVLEFFVRLKKKPEKVEPFIEQAWQETKSTDFAVITDRVYELLKQDEARGGTSPTKATPKKKVNSETGSKKDYDVLAQEGLVDDDQW